MYETQKKRRIRRPAAWLLAVLLTGVLCCQAVWADQRTLIPVGKAVGIKLFAQGVLVVGLSDITTQEGPVSPARACGLQAGDVITHINDDPVNSIEQVQTVLQDLEGGEMELTVLRDETSRDMTTHAVQCSADGAYKLGAWIRDSMAGIGTLTFYEPETGREMTVYSDMPGVQLYTFNGTSGLKNKDGSDMIPHGALCLETQFYPDSVHHENFPFRYVTPEKPFESKTIYKFTVK